jgi:hypothetical protein
MNITISGNYLFSLIGSLSFALPILAGLSFVKRHPSWLRVCLATLCAWLVATLFQKLMLFVSLGTERFWQLHFYADNFWNSAVLGAVSSFVSVSILMAGVYLLFLEAEAKKA